jgi:putative ABC transport system permease protein
VSATPTIAPSVAARRADSPHTSMFLRMLVRAAVLRRGRAASALLAMVVAAAVATAMMNLYVDVQAKLRKEFRSYGANVIVIGKDGTSLPPDALNKIETALGPRGTAVPFAYVVARTATGQSVVVAGTNFDQVQKLNRWWSVSAWPKSEAPTPESRQPKAEGVNSRSSEPIAQSPNATGPSPEPKAATQALVGMKALPVVAPDNHPFDLSFQGHTIHLTPAGTLQTGAAEDSRVYLSLPDFVAWTGVEPSTIEVAANGSAEEVNALIRQIAAALPTADVHPIRQIVEGEARVLGKTRATLYAAAVLIILTAALCVLATLTGWVFDRRRDFAIMKALGASERLISSFFAAEAAALGVVGAILGFVIGIGIAAWVGRVNFNAPVVPRLSVLPFVLAGSVAVALLSAIVPMSLLRRVQPAIILKGE